MSAFLTGYYDPENPPEPDRMDEADRLLGVSFGRGLVFFVFLAIAGGDPARALHSTLELLDQNLLYGLFAAMLLLRTLYPVLQGLEHLVIDTKNWVSG